MRGFDWLLWRLSRVGAWWLLAPLMLVLALLSVALVWVACWCALVIAEAVT